MQKNPLRNAYKTMVVYEFQKDWKSLPLPEWFNHELDLALFAEWRKPHFFERGVYVQEAITHLDRVLDLCCGDGSITALFIAKKAKSVVGIDISENAIAHATKTFGIHTNLSYKTMDIRNLSFEDNSFDKITWDAAIEHFTPTEIDKIMFNIKRIMCKNGVLIGSTIAKSNTQNANHHDHEFEFESLESMESFLKKYFSFVYTWQRKHEDRISFYFRCSDANADLMLREFEI